MTSEYIEEERIREGRDIFERRMRMYQREGNDVYDREFLIFFKQ